MIAKLKTRPELKSIVTRLKAEGKSVVLANGVFDLVHVGHIRYLKAAKESGDVLIVALNSDSSTRLIKKGQNRPLTPELERAEILGALEAVDFVCIFDEPDVRNTLLELRPDFHAKGTDYTVETVPEREIVKSYGGTTIICGDAKDHSTTNLILSLNTQARAEEK